MICRSRSSLRSDKIRPPRDSRSPEWQVAAGIRRSSIRLHLRQNVCRFSTFRIKTVICCDCTADLRVCQGGLGGIREIGPKFHLRTGQADSQPVVSSDTDPSFGGRYRRPRRLRPHTRPSCNRGERLPAASSSALFRGRSRGERTRDEAAHEPVDQPEKGH